MESGFVKIFFDVLELIQNLSIEEQGEIIYGIYTYNKTGQEPELSENALTIWPMIKDELEFESEYKPNESEAKPNESEAKANKSETNLNNQVYVNADVYANDYGYLPDDDLRLYARHAEINECYKQYIGHPPAPAEVLELITFAHHYKFDPAVLGFTIQKSAHAKNPVGYAMEMLNRWELRGIKTLSRAVEAYKTRECKVEDGGVDDLPF